MADKGTVVLRFDSRTRRDERNACLNARMKAFTPEQLADAKELLRDDNLQPHSEYILWDQMCEEASDMPKVTPVQVAAITRYSARLREIGEVDYGRARAQPSSRLSAVLQALEAQYGDRGYN